MSPFLLRSYLLPLLSIRGRTNVNDGKRIAGTISAWGLLLIVVVASGEKTREFTFGCSIFLVVGLAFLWFVVWLGESTQRTLIWDSLLFRRQRGVRPDVEEAIAKLWRNLPSGYLRGLDPIPLSIERKGRDLGHNGDVAEMCKAIAAHYRLDSSTISVAPCGNISSPGRIEIDSNHRYRIKVSNSLVSDYHALLAVLVHEVSHIVIDKWIYQTLDTGTTELLTDCIAGFAGYGPAILNAITLFSGRTQEQELLSARFYGYLTPLEFGYLAAKHDVWRGVDSRPLLVSAAARRAYRRGMTLAAKDLRYMRFATKDGYRFVIRCPVCTQRLGVPKGKGRILARCKICDEALQCKT
jgi:hypothetical protein